MMWLKILTRYGPKRKSRRALHKGLLLHSFSMSYSRFLLITDSLVCERCFVMRVGPMKGYYISKGGSGPAILLALTHVYLQCYA